ncbi:MAG: outer membrane beta-barrel protein [Bacteroidaceae bacterium]
MKKIYALFLLFLCLPLSIQAQKFSISGSIIDKQTRDGIELATVQLLTPDSAMVTGITSAKDGSFKVIPSKIGNYILKISYIGYNTEYRNLSITKNEKIKTVGTVELSTSDVALKMAQITAKIAKVEMKEDTFVYNAAAYRVPEGSMLESLIEKLPGVEVAEDGTIKANGKTVTQIMLNGKDFFKGDTKIAMKNVPVDLVEKIKSYDKQSEYTKQTGIDDGEEETVIDLSLKKKLKSSWISNIDLGAGNKDRYTSKLFANKYDEVSRFTAFGSMNNTNDQGFHGGSFRKGSGGLVASKMFGMDGMWNNGKKEREAGFLEFGGNIRYNYTGSDKESSSNSESFLTAGSSSSFFNNRDKGKNSSSNLNAGFRLEWSPDTMTSITFRPSFSHTEGNNWSESQSATFNANPYQIEGITDPLTSAFELSNPELKKILVNTNDRKSLGNNNSNNFNAEIEASRRLNNKGRNISFSGEVAYDNHKSKSFSLSNIYYQSKDSLAKTNQYSSNPQKNWNYRVGLSYSEPLIAKTLFLQSRYQFQYRYSDSDRSLYQMQDSLIAWGIPTPPLGTLPFPVDTLELMRDLRNSQYATYKYFNHDINLGLRWVTEKINLNAGISIQPQTTEMAYQKDRMDTLITRNVLNVSPKVRFRYKFSKTSQLNIRYNGNPSQPSMTNLLDIRDDSDPLNISIGNPSLKPSWTNSLTVFYNNYISERQQGFMVNANFSQTSNEISTAVEYNDLTGVRITQPKNINGNWNARSSVMFNTALGTEKAFNVSTYTNLNYDNSVGYVSVNKGNSEKSTSKTLGIGEYLRGSYRSDLFEIGLNANLNYQHTRNDLQHNANMDTYNYSYGGNVQFSLPWSMSLSSDIGMNSRRGYSDNSMNTNEIIWNAQISQSFLRNKSATLSIQFYDILKEQSNVSRIINAQIRRDTWSNAINSYCMVHFSYRLNIFAGGKSKGDGGDDKGTQKGRKRGATGRSAGMPMMRMGEARHL